MKNIPEDLKYTKTHEWVKTNPDGSVSIGVTHHAQSLLGDMVFIELPEMNREFQQGTEMAVLESVKAAADVYCPLSGTVTDVNQALQNEPELINQEPYTKGWICKLMPNNNIELNNLLSAEDYQKEIH